MTKLKFYCTLHRKKMEFVPHNEKKVQMYVCGPTVYDYAHIGNARPVVIFDLLYRILRRIYGASSVTYVRNFTDVDDKINERASAKGIEISTLTDFTIKEYLSDMDAIGALRPDFMPRATEYISQMIEMIDKLIKSNNAYHDNGHVLFSVNSAEDYGRLSRRTLKEMKAGARVEVADNKVNPMDFVLWKPSNENLPGWDSPWGRGRPGWHIECSAMCNEILGHSFDIHGGGIDLAFPHHENEIAQSSCANPGGEFAKYWMHNGMLTVEGRKMSKSIGNFVTVRDLLKKGVNGDAIRLALFSGHYRQPLNWTGQRLDECLDTVKKWNDLTLHAEDNVNPSIEFIEALHDDLNTPKAISILHSLAKNGNLTELLSSLRLIGLLQDQKFESIKTVSTEIGDVINNIIKKRNDAKEEKNFELADNLRSRLINCGVTIKDLKTGVDWEVTDSFDEDQLRQI